MTLRESHQICQLDLVTLTEPLQAYIPKEEDIQIPLKKLEANSEAPITPETTVQPENTEDLSTDPKPDEPTTEILPESEESPKTEEQNTPLETINEPTDESVSDPPEMTQTPAESVSESVQTPSERQSNHRLIRSKPPLNHWRLLQRMQTLKINLKLTEMKLKMIEFKYSVVPIQWNRAIISYYIIKR